MKIKDMDWLNLQKNKSMSCKVDDTVECRHGISILEDCVECDKLITETSDEDEEIIEWEEKLNKRIRQ